MEYLIEFHANENDSLDEYKSEGDSKQCCWPDLKMAYYLTFLKSSSTDLA